MKIDILKVGMLETNCYVVSNGEKAVIIDPGADAEKIAEFIDSKKLSVEYILLTHTHFDHIGVLAAVKEKTGAKIAVGEADKEAIKLPADLLLRGGESINAASLDFRVLNTPGHTRGGVCYIFGDVIFSGDTLFCESIGRSDLPGGSFDELRVSLKRLFKLDGDFTVYPGHGDSTTLSHERQYNPFKDAVK